MIHLSAETFNFYVAHHYDARKAHSIEEFLGDVKRFKYIKRLMTRYKELGDLQERLILNHIIILHNCLGPSLIPMLFFKLQGFDSELKTFLVFLNHMPDTVSFGEVMIRNSDIPIDLVIADRLRRGNNE